MADAGGDTPKSNDYRTALSRGSSSRSPDSARSAEQLDVSLDDEGVDDVEQERAH